MTPRYALSTVMVVALGLASCSSSPDASSSGVDAPSPTRSDESAADNRVTPEDSTPDATGDESQSPEQTDVERSPVLISEIHYHPADDRDDEFIEIANVGPDDVDLTGWCVDGIDHCFDAEVLRAGGHLAVTAFEGSLSNGGETITLFDGDMVVRDSVDYDDHGVWPALADGEGASIQRRSLTSGTSGPGNWSALSPSPGSPNPEPGSPVPVIEINSVPDAVTEGTPIVVDASILERPDDGRWADQVWLDYRIDFGDPQRIEATVSDDGTVSAVVPPQSPGALVRYRMSASNDRGEVGAWPRLDSGRDYDGVVVDTTTPAETDLPRVQWFIEDDAFDEAVLDLERTGDEGVPFVLVVGGAVFDGARLRVKGETSRFDPKKKWKVVLPPGLRTDVGGRLVEPVDEFALHSSWVDRSFVREPLAVSMLATARVPHPEVFPVRVERSGAFFGLYNFVEEADGTWRDRYGFDDAVVYQVDGQPFDARLPESNARLSEEEFREIYDKKTHLDQDDDDLRTLIVDLAAPTLDERVDVIHERFDIPAVVNMMAANAIIQHNDYGQKNYFLIQDQYERWTVVPTDFDLTFGRWFQSSSPDCWTTCDDVAVTGLEPERLSGPLFGTFLRDPGLRSLVARRIRQLLPTTFDVDDVLDQIETMSDAVEVEARRDREVWGTWSPETPGAAAQRLIDDFVLPQRAVLDGDMVSEGYVAGEMQPAIPLLRFGDARDGVLWSVDNLDAVAIDLSEFRIGGVGFDIPAGTVLAPGERLLVVADDIDSLPELHSALGAASRTTRVIVMDENSIDEDVDELTLLSDEGAIVTATPWP